MSTRTRVRTLAVTAAAIALTLIAAPAVAHDELVASDPASNEVLAQAPAEIDLTFSAEIMQIGAAIIVAGADETDWVASDPVIDFDTLTVALAEGMPEGSYEVRWRVVSSDGHPISGVVPFAVGHASAATDAPQAQTTQAQTTDSQDGGIPRAVWIGAIGAAAALTIFGLILFFVRGRRTRGRGDSSTQSHDS